MKNYYQILGISSNATEKDIKLAYRKLALLYHPDKNNGSKTAENKFKEIGAAYNILGDTNKRQAYDFDLRKEREKKENLKTQKQERERAARARTQQNKEEAERKKSEKARQEREEFERRARDRRQEEARQKRQHEEQQKTRNTNPKPQIIYFFSEKDFYTDNGKIHLKWKVLNADFIKIEPFGQVYSSHSSKTWQLISPNPSIRIKIYAKNTKTGVSVEEEIRLTLRTTYKTPSSEYRKHKTYKIDRTFNWSLASIDTDKIGSFFSIKGRINRATYAIRFFSIIGVHFLSLFICGYFGWLENELLFYLFHLTFVYLTAAQTIQRLHDFNVSGWLILLFFLPLAFPIFLIFIMLKPGDEYFNNYG